MSRNVDAPFLSRAVSAIVRYGKLTLPPLALGALTLCAGIAAKSCDDAAIADRKEASERAAACDMWRYQVTQAHGNPSADLIAGRPEGCSPYAREYMPATYAPAGNPGTEIGCPCITTDSTGTHCRNCREEYGRRSNVTERYGRY